ncbi:MAG: neutral/alkaline non-lysosomal ceramidase N-terminal domain-containing protein [Clostridia bacterium]|nr:neutral/alkaline non-lysosomal ceramidase N-terminal domain-containing protein [Clostridia bacterium]
MLKAGFSRVDITPPLGTRLEGYFEIRHMKGILDPLYLNALALSDGEKTVLLITADVLQIRKNYADEIKAFISEKTGVDKNNIELTALHQHTSFGVRDLDSYNAVKDKNFMETLYRKFADVSAMAIEDMAETTAETAEKETSEQLSFIRRYVMNDGTVMTYPESRRSEIVRPCRESDNTVRLVRFKREKGDIALVNFSTHPDVIHGEYVSADWPGFVRAFVEKDIEGTRCICTVGAQGDSNHMEFMAKEYKDGYEHSKRMGRVIADTVISMWNNTEKRDTSTLSAHAETMFIRTRTDGEEQYEEMKKLLADYNAGTYTGRKLNITDLGSATRIVNLKTATLYQQIPVTVINLGEIGIAGYGGEPFTKYADALRKAFPERFIITCCCMNGGEGYLPTKEAFHEIGYEAGSSPFSENLEEKCVNAAIEMLNR